MFKLFSQKPPGETITLKIEGMHCTSCAMNIDGALEEDLPGVISSSTTYAKSQTKVTFDPSQTNLEQIQEAIRQSGYTSVLQTSS